MMHAPSEESGVYVRQERTNLVVARGKTFCVSGGVSVALGPGRFHGAVPIQALVDVILKKLQCTVVLEI